MAEEKLPKSFEELVRTSDVPVFVDFWADWCAPCHQVAPAVRQLAQEYKGRIRVVKVNVDKQPHIASKYMVQSIPTLMIFYAGEIVWRFSGALPYSMLKEKVDEVLQKLSGP